ncbi:MAG: hypothetical protein SX243_07015 [Acidobacteriota bacterium]|nr:hypothetical protein [Acidobacteriota bacterium]
MDSFWIILIGAAIFGILIAIGKNQAKETAETAYKQSLTELKLDPTNAELREKTLDLGRKYSNLTRDGKGIAIFDEIALMNDLNAAAGGSMALADGPPTQPPLRDQAPPRANPEARLKQLTSLKEKGLIEEEEFEERRAKILDEL